MGFPEQLKKARSNMNYTQQEIADLMGISKSTYCGYETGKRQPDVAKIKHLAIILKTSGDTLLETGFAPSHAGDDLADEFIINDKQLAKQYNLLSNDNQELIKKLINALIKK